MALISVICTLLHRALYQFGLFLEQYFSFYALQITVPILLQISIRVIPVSNFFRATNYPETGRCVSQYLVGMRRILQVRTMERPEFIVFPGSKKQRYGQLIDKHQ
jgi:hypothetical protein